MDFEIRYKKGKDIIVPDALSRRSDLALLEEIDDQLHCRWPRRYSDVTDYIRTCSSCQLHERSRENQETGLQVPLPVVGPLERWSSDLVQMPESYKNKYKWILTVIDHCTSWPVAVPLKEATVAELA